MLGGKGTYEPCVLHRFIMDAKENQYIDHINHNTLDNRKDNLRVLSNKENLTNRNGKNNNNKSGYRNVCWVNKEHKWLVQLQVDGVSTVLGRFEKDDVEAAGEFAERMREKYYGKFKGLN